MSARPLKIVSALVVLGALVAGTRKVLLDRAAA